MKKFGFTLAEVLITLGIIGVVAALTTPALIQNIGMAKVGPALSKAVSTFENANQTMLAQEDANTITGLMGSTFATRLGYGSYGDKLSEYLKIVREEGYYNVPTYTQYDSSSHYTPETLNSSSSKTYNWHQVAFNSEDGITYYILPAGKISPEGYANIPSNQLIGQVYIDINGYAKPNKQAKDIFRFYLYNDGTLRAYGSTAFDRTRPQNHYNNSTHYNWYYGCNDDTHGVVSADTCAGAIFDNNMKVTYE